jgi:hypothetical protein
MCPPSLKRGDSVDGDDKNKINNLNLLGGEEPQQQQPLHHHGIDDIAISSTSNNFTATSSNTVKMGTSMRSYDEFNNGRFWKSNDYEDNLTNDHAGDEDTGCVCLLLVFSLHIHLFEEMIVLFYSKNC